MAKKASTAVEKLPRVSAMAKKQTPSERLTASTDDSS
jgi:hypothetical protein